MSDNDRTAVPTYDEVMARYIDAAEKANRYLSQLDRVEEQLTDARARIAELESPPIGFVVLAQRPGRDEGREFRYDTAGSIWPEREPVDNHRGHCEDVAKEERPHDDVEYIVAEIREAVADV